MTKRIKTRLWIFAGGAAVAVLAWFAPPANEDVAAPAKAGAGSANAPAAQREASRLAALPRRAPIGEQRGELFGSKTWTPPVAAARPAAAPPPAEPVAPPNPYKVAGTLVQAGAKRVYLVKGDRVYEANQGDDLDDGYRVDSIAVDHVVLLYVPLGKKEELAIASTLGADIALASTAPAPAPRVVPVPGAAPAPRFAPESAAPVAPAASASAGSSDHATPAELRWEGPGTVRAGASFTVALRVSSDQPLRATPMQLRYEPELLEAVGVRAGKFFGEGNFSYRVNPDGSIFVGATGQGMAPGADAELVVVTFKPIKPGATEVKLSSVALQGAAGRALAHNQVGAFRTDIR